MKLPALARLSMLLVAIAACTSTVPASSTPPGSMIAPTPAPPTSSPSAPAASPTDDGIPDPPPDGALGYSDFAQKGRLGSYCYDGGCADVAVWPPTGDGLPTVETQGEPLVFSVDKNEFDQWSVTYGTDSGAPMPLAEGGEPTDPDMGAQSPGPATSFVEFNSPPAGDWVVTMRVYFAGGGSASYAWRVIVE